MPTLVLLNGSIRGIAPSLLKREGRANCKERKWKKNANVCLYVMILSMLSGREVGCIYAVKNFFFL